jgi:hypothetical protein
MLGTKAVGGETSAKTDKVCLSDFLIHIALTVTRDGSLLKSTNDQAWYSLLNELKTNLQLTSMPGRPKVLDKVELSWDGLFWASRTVDDVLSSVGTISTRIGALTEYGWSIHKQMGKEIKRELDELPLDYREFVERAAELARSYIVSGNIVEILPVPVEKLARSQ